MAVKGAPHAGGAVIALVLGLLAAGTARAQSPAPAVEERAREEFRLGAEALQHGELARAAEHFEAAQALSPNPVVLYDLGQTYSALGLPVKAERALRLYLASDPRPSDPARTQEVEELIAFNQRRIGVLVVEKPPPGVALELDGAALELPADGRVRLAVGRHVVVAQDAASGSRVVNVDVRAGEDARVRFDFAAPPLAPPAPAPPPLPAPTSPARTPSSPAPTPPVFSPNPARPHDAAPTGGGDGFRAAGLGALAVGAAGLVTGVVFGVEAIHRNDDSYAGGHCDRSTCDAVGLPLRSSALRDGDASTALLVAGAATAALGLACYFYFAPRNERPSSAAFAPRRLRLVATRRGFGEAALAAGVDF
ncbi:MAG TPA: tetratricopeptide repeat protein [Polyangiaceae bacterium]|nr:tetratricopeptide repeat protein [Polyangiaceae bacterium]